MHTIHSSTMRLKVSVCIIISYLCVRVCVCVLYYFSSFFFISPMQFYFFCCHIPSVLDVGFDRDSVLCEYCVPRYNYSLFNTTLSFVSFWKALQYALHSFRYGINALDFFFFFFRSSLLFSFYRFPLFRSSSSSSSCICILNWTGENVEWEKAQKK